jgi:hypothetical protein
VFVELGPANISVFRIRTPHAALSYHSVGNKRFRDAVSAALPKYMKADNRYAKSLVVHTIVNDIHQAGGRFLKYNPATRAWTELNEKEAKEKVGHAVRDAVTAYQNRRKRGKRKKPTGFEEEGKSEKPPPPASVNLHQAFASLSSSMHRPVRSEAGPAALRAGESYGFASTTRESMYPESERLGIPMEPLVLPDMPSSISAAATTHNESLIQRRDLRRPPTHGGGDPHDQFLAAIDSVLGPLPPGAADPMGPLFDAQQQSKSGDSSGDSSSGARL